MLHIHRTTAWTSKAYSPAAPVRIGGREPDLYVGTLGRFYSTGRFNYQQISPRHALHVVECGQGVMCVKGADHRVGAGDIFTFFPRNHVHYYDAPPTPWRYTWINLEGRLTNQALAQVGLTRAQPHLTGDWATLLEPLFQEIIAAYTPPNVSPAFATAAAWRLIHILEAHEPPPHRDADPAAAARFIMEHHFREGITIQDIAQRLRLSRATLFRHFRLQYRVSPKAYLESLRLAQAQKFLRQSNSGLKEIATACGYHSLPHFVRMFHKSMGQPPGAWRQTHAN